jgi:hypothetical protein
VPFEERDIEKSWRVALEWTALDDHGVPLTLVGQRVAHGLREDEIREAFEPAGFHLECWGGDALPDLREATRLR